MILVLPALLALLGCTPHGIGPALDDSGSQVVGPVRYEQTTATVTRVSWTVPAGATGWVDFGLDGALDQRVPAQGAVDGELSLYVLGMKAGRSYALRPAWTDAEGMEHQEEEVRRDTPLAPRDLPALQVDTPLPELAAAEGYVLLSIMQADHAFVAILDRDADYVWWADLGSGLTDPTIRMAANGQDVLVGVYDVQQAKDIGVVERIALRTGEVTTTRTPLGHHDFLELPDGQIAFLRYDTRDRLLGGVVQPVTGDDIATVAEGAAEGAPLGSIFDLQDDWVAPEVVCSHVELLVLGTGGKDWSHGNSLAYVPELDAVVMVARHLDTAIYIDRSTGTPLFWLSPYKDGLGGAPFPAFDHGHMSDAWQDGILIFDNGDHRPDRHSRVVEYALDADNHSYRQTFEYWEPEGRFNEILGDARRMPNSNKLISWSALGRLTEVTPDGRQAWTVQSDVGSIFGRVRWLDDLQSPSDPR